MTVTTDEAAALVGVKPATIRGWVLRRQLTPIRMGVSPLRFHEEDVIEADLSRRSQVWHDTLDTLAERLACA